MTSNQPNRFFLVTVGTSLLRESRDVRWKNRASQQTLSTPEPDCDFLGWFHKDRGGVLAPSVKNAVEGLNSIRTLSDLPKMSAELAALFGEGDAPPFHQGRDDRIVLVATRTEAGAFCAWVLRDFLLGRAQAAGAKSADAVQIDFPECLGSADDEQFAKLGLGKFLNRCLEHLRKAREEKRRPILLPNGGYKVLLGFLTVLGMVEDAPLRYVYEDSQLVLNLPHLPVGLDIIRWQTDRNHFLPYIDAPWNPRLERFAGLVGNHAGTTRLEPLGQTLEEHFRRVEDRTSLQRITGHTSLHRYLKPEGEAFQVDDSRRFIRLAEIADVIWYGDRVADMVDHAARHHYDLFDLAERVLLPLFERAAERVPGSRFLEPHELFALLGALYLHDCGNVVGSLPGYGELTEDEIRDHHHVLGFCRLESGQRFQGQNPPIGDDFLGASLYGWLTRPEGLKSPGAAWKREIPEWNWSSLWDEWLRTIAILGVYHRSRTPLKSLPKDPEKRYTFLKPVPPLTQNDGTVVRALLQLGSYHRCGQRGISGERMILLAALLRIIDCLDQKAHRAGSPQLVEAHLANLARECAAIERWLARARGCFGGDDLKALEGCLAIEKTSQDRKVIAAYCKVIIDKLKEKHTGAELLLLEEYQRRLDRRAFKLAQGEGGHFQYKQTVKEVKLATREEAGKLVYTISLVTEEGFEKKDQIQAANKIREEITREYENTEVAEILSHHGIVFEFPVASP